MSRTRVGRPYLNPYCQASRLSGLQALGAPVQTVGDVPAALRERQRSLWQRGVEPVLVTWQEEPLQVELRLPAVRTDGVLHCHLAFETGESQRWTVDLDSLMTFPGDALEQTR